MRYTALSQLTKL